MNSWGEYWGNKGTFKVKRECLRDCVFFGVYFNIDLLTNEEKNSWEILKNNAKKALSEIESFKCPICKRKAKVGKYFKLDNFKLKCPFQESCVFDIGDNCGYFPDFIAEQILVNNKKLFDFGFT